MNESGSALVPLLKRTSLEDLSATWSSPTTNWTSNRAGCSSSRRGGLAGHNGLRSIAQTLGTQDFSRLRIGIGKPPRKEQGADYVLQRLDRRAQAGPPGDDVAAAADAIEMLLDYDFDEAQRRVNGARG
jgi:PTH1 family peptidyl-tRNA hydrolase